MCVCGASDVTEMSARFEFDRCVCVGSIRDQSVEFRISGQHYSNEWNGEREI